MKLLSILLFLAFPVFLYAQATTKPNHVDVTTFGARAVTSIPSTTVTISSGSANATLAAASTFRNGDGVVCRGCGATLAISTPSAPTVTASNASVLTGTGYTLPNTSGATTYQYCVAARTTDAQLTPCSANTSITNGPAQLGANKVKISSWTRSDNTVTVTLSVNHNMVGSTMFTIAGADGTIVGTFNALTATPGTNTFTFTSNSDVRNGASASGGVGGTVTYYTANHITWAHVAGASQYYIYGRTSGSMVLLGVSYPDNPNFSGFVTYNEWDDFGSTMSVAPGVPDWVPSTPPVSGKNGDLVTRIVSGAPGASVTLANTAVNSVRGGTFKFDDTPGIVAAFTAANQQAAVYFPAAGSGFYPTNSYMALPAASVSHWVYQAGTLSLGDTMNIGTVNWTGVSNPNNIPQFGLKALPSINGAGAFPMIYETNEGGGGAKFTDVNVTNLAANGLGYLQDHGGIPSSQFRNVQFSVSASKDYMGISAMIRGHAINGGPSKISFRDCVFTSNQGLTGATPLLYFYMAGNPITMSNTMFSGRGVFIASSSPGIQANIDDVYIQGGGMPLFSIVNGTLTGLASLAMTVNGAILDTTSTPLVTNFGGLLGSLKIANTPGPSPGSPLVTGAQIAVETKSIPSGTIIPNMNSEDGIQLVPATDGILNRSDTTNYPIKRLNAALSVGAAFQIFANALPQAAPTCAVSTSGSVPVATYRFAVAPTFPNGGSGTSLQGEGPLSGPSSTCTTSSGNQTVAIKWTAVAGATGYDLYYSTGSSFQAFQCSTPWVPGTQTSYVWSSVAPCNPGAPTMPGTGPVSLTSSGLTSPQYKLTAANGGGVVTVTSPSLTANRTQTAPDTSGTQVLSNGPLLTGDFAVFDSSGRIVDGGAQYKKLRCEPALGDGLNAIPAGTHLQSNCYNDSGVTWTITAVKCFTDNNGTSTLNAAGNTLGALLTGAVTCSNSWAAGTQSTNVALTAGDYIKFAFVADGTSKQTTFVVSMTQ